MSTRLTAVVVEPTGTARAAVIWLHGLGADGHDFAPIVPELELPTELGVRFVFPHAESIPVTVNGGYVMPAWYDIREIHLQRRHDEPGVRRSAARIEAAIAHEVEQGVPAERIVLAGFSQGGAVAAFTALRHEQRLAGAVLLSTYLIGADSLAAEGAAANRSLPILQAHGTADPIVPLARGAASSELLRAHGCRVDFRSYAMAHTVCAEEIEAIGTFLRQVLAD